MPVPKGATLDPARTREAILESATALLYERGLDGIGVAELCAAVGASKETLYRHFGSKDGLIEAVLENRSRRVLAWIADAAASAGAAPKARLTAVFRALATWYAAPGFRGCAIVNAAAQRHTSPATPIAARHLAGYLDLFTDIARATGVPEPEALGRQFLVLLQGATVVADHLAAPEAADTALSAALTLLEAAREPRP
ncbi:TetR/AcrR family transcriptional regulator [Streptomyces sparsogenes]|uniref:TetR family transcriptional regulator n=1 Tax=Streptomyces sparsogenes DSM 40356 TaxID=1331668 RepID=A0A1R1SPX7_9ACTN|nr:TetR/AcrR family transcriptional regulator [Streptomyces sparsogenes]OMI40354.1 TetR family transcriptional regulator [Streptomyces sparsogenes DSM 40356]